MRQLQSPCTGQRPQQQQQWTLQPGVTGSRGTRASAQPSLTHCMRGRGGSGIHQSGGHLIARACSSLAVGSSQPPPFAPLSLPLEPATAADPSVLGLFYTFLQLNRCTLTSWVSILPWPASWSSSSKTWVAREGAVALTNAVSAVCMLSWRMLCNIDDGVGGHWIACCCSAPAFCCRKQGATP